MNKEILERLELAGHYQKKALRALFPEEMGEHLDVIEQELKAMFMELAAEAVKQYNTSKKETAEESNTKTNVKKVDIE
ncbi:MAG: hypothetical protein PUD93_10350 [Lachnospiraceae bacterium]|nr:hypothetical protein [Lachnospiraceae bacterium]